MKVENDGVVIDHVVNQFCCGPHILREGEREWSLAPPEDEGSKSLPQSRADEVFRSLGQDVVVQQTQ